jgi:hypothetical protein
MMPSTATWEAAGFDEDVLDKTTADALALESVADVFSGPSHLSVVGEALARLSLTTLTRRSLWMRSAALADQSDALSFNLAA